MTDDEMKAAARRLYEHLGGVTQRVEHFRSVGVGDGCLHVFCFAERGAKSVPTSWEGLDVITEVRGPIRLCAGDMVPG